MKKIEGKRYVSLSGAVKAAVASMLCGIGIGYAKKDWIDENLHKIDPSRGVTIKSNLDEFKDPDDFTDYSEPDTYDNKDIETEKETLTSSMDDDFSLREAACTTMNDSMSIHLVNDNENALEAKEETSAETGEMADDNSMETLLLTLKKCVDGMYAGHDYKNTPISLIESAKNCVNTEEDTIEFKSVVSKAIISINAGVALEDVCEDIRKSYLVTKRFDKTA